MSRLPRKALAIELAVLLVAAAILLALQDLSFTTDDLSRGGKGYVSDEIWYVSSARNILEKVFGAQPRQVQGLGATVVYEGTLNSSFLEGLSRACNVSYRSDYYKISAVYVEASSPTRLECFLDGLRSAVKVNDVVYGWMLPDTQGIDTYMNLEHPPAGKYVLCLEMLLLGDYPTYWRIGPIVAGLATLALTVLAVRELTG
ncbi:MAG: glycosyl transferase family 39, partial [Desulfurococcaceae archaeon]